MGTPATGSSPVDSGGIVVAVSAVVVVIGAFLGWYATPVGETVRWFDGLVLFRQGSPLFSGLTTTVVATVATMLALLLPDEEGVNAITAVAGLAIELVAVAFLVAPHVALGPAFVAGTETTLAGTGIGLFLTLVGGIGILFGGVLSYRR